MIEGSESVLLTNGPGSGRPKNLRILQIRIRNTSIQLEVNTDIEQVDVQRNLGLYLPT
jgi:hypothetical protein